MTDFMTEAIELSQYALDHDAGGPFGAVVVKDNQVIGRGYNQVTSKNDPTAHAEIVAIREACKHTSQFKLEGSVLYSSCEPCPMCLSAAYWARIETVVYANSRGDAAAVGFDDNLFYREMAIPMNKRSIKMEHSPNNQAKIVFDNWRNKENKIRY